MYNFSYQYVLCGVVSTITLLSCQSLSSKKSQIIPKNLSSYQSAFLSGIMEIQHQNNTQNILFDITLSESGKLRMNLIATLDIPLMTILITSKGLSTALFFPSKQYYQGMYPEKLAEQFFIPQFNFNLLKKILLDQRPVEKTWSCGYNEEKLPVQCNNKSIYIKWDRKINRSLLLRTKDGQIKLYYKKFQSFTGKEIPDLPVPEHFKPITIKQ